MAEGRLQLFSGTAHPELFDSICQVLNLPPGRATVGVWNNGETRVKIEDNVRGSDVFIMQTMADPIDHHLVEFLLMIDAVRRASADRITAVIPYYAYARQEKKTTGRVPIAAKLVANLLVTAGVDRLLTLDLHAPAIEGFFDIPVDHLRAAPLLARRYSKENPPGAVVVSPDAGGVLRAQEFRARSGGGLSIISKNRPGPDTIESMEMVGDVAGKTAVIVDDMISTGGTLLTAAELLKERGASTIHAAATHGIFAGNALELIERSSIEKVYVTDSLPTPADVPEGLIEVVTIAPLLAEAINRIHRNMSVSALFT